MTGGTTGFRKSSPRRYNFKMRKYSDPNFTSLTNEKNVTSNAPLNTVSRFFGYRIELNMFQPNFFEILITIFGHLNPNIPIVPYQFNGCRLVEDESALKAGSGWCLRYHHFRPMELSSTFLRSFWSPPKK